MFLRREKVNFLLVVLPSEESDNRSKLPEIATRILYQFITLHQQPSKSKNSAALVKDWFQYQPEIPLFNGGDLFENPVPFPQLPIEICFEIWKYLSKQDIVQVSRVSKSWKHFSTPLFIKELSKCGHRHSFTQRVFVDLPDEKREMTFELKVLFLTSEGWAEATRDRVNESDAIIYAFPKVDDESFDYMKKFSEHYHISKDYTNEFPDIIFADNMDDERRLTKLIVNNNLGYVKIKDDVSHICVDYTRNLTMEKKREKGLKESFAHKITRKSDLIKGCAAATFVSLIVSVIVMIPGIVILHKHSDSASIMFGTIFISLGILEFLVWAFLMYYFAKMWYFEDPTSNPRYRRSCVLCCEYKGCV